MTQLSHRRSFLKTAAAATTVFCCQRTIARQPSGKQADVIVGAHPWVYAATLPNYDITPKLDQIFADMAYAGMAGIELMHTSLRPDGAVSRIKELSKRHQLPVLGTSFSGAIWDRDQQTAVLEDAELVLSRLAKVGGTTLGVSVGDAGRRKTEAELDQQAGLLKRIMAIADVNGVTVNLHNHKYEVRDDMHDLRGTLARIPDAKLGPDLDWLVQADVDPVAFIREFGDRLVFLHLRDQKADKTWVEAMGEGDRDFAKIAQVLDHVHFTGHAVIELAHPRGMKLSRPLRESLKLSRDFVRATMGY